MPKPKVLLIVGPTASGKTALSVALAQHFDGEVISADSRQVYRGLDIGTGKVTPQEMADIPHHLLDVADPHERFTAYDFKELGTRAVHEILDRQHVPIIAGGTFFYVDALLGRINTPPVEPNEELRAQLEQKPAADLYIALEKLDPRRAAEIDPDNKPRLIRALEIVAALGAVPEQSQADIPYNVLTIGLDLSRSDLHKKIYARIIDRIDIGMIEEVEQLHAHGLSYERMEELGLEYRHISQYLQNKLTKDDLIALLDTKTRQFAKRQLTWLKRDTSIVWFRPENREAIFRHVEDFLNKRT